MEYEQCKAWVDYWEKAQRERPEGYEAEAHSFWKRKLAEATPPGPELILCPACHAANPTEAHLIQEYTQLQSACFGFFKRNAREVQNAVVEMLFARGITHIPNILGDIPIERWDI